MTARPDVELAIVGGGCAGLSLAQRLASQGAGAPRTVVLEPRANYQADRTWSFWLGPNVATEIEQLIDKRWPAWRIATPEQGTLHTFRDRPYAVVPSERFYVSAEQRIALNQNVVLDRGTKALSLNECSDRVEIETNRGRMVAGRVIDARPPKPETMARSILFQTFVGVEVEVERPVFDASAVELMTDMRVDQDGFVFTYVLPFTDRHALIEVTRFIERPHLPSRLGRDLQEAVDRRVGGVPYITLRREQGVLPMGLPRAAPNSPRVIPAGTAAGAVRPATGYAFLRIQRWANICAAKIGQGQPPLMHPADPPLRHAMDRLFLQVLRSQPEMAPRIFLALGRGLQPQTFVRFLSDEASSTELLAVVTALPPWPFLRTLFSAPTKVPGIGRRKPA